jgi:hypothetical protein
MTAIAGNFHDQEDLSRVLEKLFMSRGSFRDHEAIPLACFNQASLASRGAHRPRLHPFRNRRYPASAGTKAKAFIMNDLSRITGKSFAIMAQYHLASPMAGGPRNIAGLLSMWRLM